MRFHVAGVLAVHLVAVVHDAAAIHENVDGILAQISGIGHRTRNSWRKVEDLRVIAAAEGQGGDGFVIDDTAVGGAVGLKNVGGGFDGDLLGGLAELQPNVHRGGCGDINADARKCLRPKTRSGNRKGVSARRQQGDDEVAVGIGLRGANQGGSDVRRGNGGLRNGSLRRIGDRPNDLPGSGGLRAHRRRLRNKKKSEEQDECSNPLASRVHLQTSNVKVSPHGPFAPERPPNEIVVE